MGRRAGTVSSSSASRERRTRREASSGTSSSIGSCKLRTPSSTSVRAATATMGLVSEAIRKMASRASGVSSAHRRCADGVDVYIVAAGHEGDQTRDVAGCNLRCQLVVHTVQSLLRQRVGRDLVVGQGFTPGWCRAM